MFARAILLKAKHSPVMGPAYTVAKNAYAAFSTRGQSRVNVLTALPLFRPNSGGSYRMLAPLTLQAANDTLPALANLLPSLDRRPAAPVTTADFAARNGAGDPAALAALFDRYGSDKAGDHDYHIVYASLLARVTGGAAARVLEIGLGTNNTDVASNMGIKGQPGASLRAFRDFLPGAEIVGADIDARILFSEDRITCHQLDQTDPSSFAALGNAVPGDFDLMIDDGLHAPNANLNALAFFLDRLKPGGAAVIEDIPPVALPVWQVVQALVPTGYTATIVQARRSLMFVCVRDAVS